jgi:RND superfamily putative drug exporter
MLSGLARLASGRRSRWAVIGAWVALAAALAPFQAELAEHAADESETFLARGSDSAEAERLLSERFEAGDEVATTIVYRLPDTEEYLGGEEDRIVADAVAICRSDAIADLKAVITPRGPACDDAGDEGADLGPEIPLSSVSGDVALTTVLTSDDDTPTVVADVEAIREIVPAPDPPAGELGAYVSGQGGLDADRAAAVEGIDGTLMAISVALIVVLLLAIYRSPLVAAVPLGVVAVAYLVAAGAIWGLVSAGATTISGQTTAILIVLMFGAGTDYCLLIVARYRDELRRTDDVQAAMSEAAARTGPAILSAGATVAAALLVLGLADFNATREMGPILALGIAVMVLAGLTLLPAVLAVCGRRAFWPAIPRHIPGETERSAGGAWARVAAAVERRPAATAVVATAVLVLGAFASLDGREDLDFTESFRDPPDSVAGVEAIREAFAPGRAAPVDLVLSAPVSAEVIAPLADLPGVDVANWAAASDPANAGGPEPGDDYLVKGEVILDADPFSEEAKRFIPELRAEVDRLLATALAQRDGGEGGELALVGGLTAESYDTEHTVARDTRLIIPLTLILVLAILVALLRSVVAPLVVIASVGLSYLFALGVSSLVFTHVFGQPGSDPSLEIFAFIFLVGLGVDYSIFLVTRVREERERGLATRPAVRAALARTGGVITSAGLILTGTFCSLMALTFEALFQFGFVIALGLLVDTFLVRVFLVPAALVWLGERSWWPQRTDRPGREPDPARAEPGEPDGAALTDSLP